MGKTSFIPKCLCIVCEGKDGLASERKGSKRVAGVMIDDVVCVCVCMDRVDRFIPLRAWCSRMSAVFTQGSRRLAAIPAGTVPIPNMDGTQYCD